MVLKKQDRARAQIQKPAIKVVGCEVLRLQKPIAKNIVVKGGANDS